MHACTRTTALKLAGQVVGNRLTWHRLPHVMWVVRNAVHVRMSAMEDIGHVIILAIISCQVIVWVHAAIIMHALPLQHDMQLFKTEQCYHAHLSFWLSATKSPISGAHNHVQLLQTAQDILSQAQHMLVTLKPSC